MKLSRFVLIFVSLLVVNSIIGQTIIEGKVFDKNTGEALIGATIVIKGTTEGAITDFDGAFRINSDKTLPLTIEAAYVGYLSETIIVNNSDDKIRIKLSAQAIDIDVVEITGQRISDKQKAAPLTVESMDIIAIKETPADNFYDGLGTLKGVDLTAASLGFKIINTRGFNSTSPVRSLQLIDGVDNQAPGLNFSLGNFLGSPELDVQKVDIIQGASSAFYGPNAFNGVIAMETKNPFLHEGLALMIKGGERNLAETSLRFADAFKNKEGDPYIAYKFNFSFLSAHDWEAENYDPVYGTHGNKDNPGGFDAVNIYGDEYFPANDFTTAPAWVNPGLGLFHRTAYEEIDLVDYDTRNIKTNLAFHFRTKPSKIENSPELILSNSFGTGNTVYQGDNRFRLKNILFFQNRLELRKQDKYFMRLYTTHEDAGNSYDPYATSLKMQEEAKPNENWGQDYANYWQSNINSQINDLGYPQLQFVGFDSLGFPIFEFDHEAADQWLIDYNDSLVNWHDESEAFANLANPLIPESHNFYAPGTPGFEESFQRTTTSKSNSTENGTLFYDKSALYHAQGEYKIQSDQNGYLLMGASGRIYQPNSDGTIFYDTAGTKITNKEMGVYIGMQQKLFENRLTANFTLRVDKNENFDLISTPAISFVFKPAPNNFLRLSFSSAIRNPTLTDQYLYLDVGRAILAGNLNGVDSLVTVESFREYRSSQNPDDFRYFNIDPVRPEKVKTFEIGYRTTLFKNLYTDAGYYYSIYNDFLGYNIGIDVELTEIGLIRELQVYRYSANSINTVKTQGFAIGLNYYFGTYYSLNGNYSWNQLVKTVDDDPIIPAFNTPEHKYNIGLSGRDVVINIGERSIKNFGFNFNYKWIQGFLFEGSPQFTGEIPTYDLFDGQINYNVKKIHTTFKLGASNLLNNKQFQTYGGPRIGRLAYLSITYDFRKK